MPPHLVQSTARDGTIPVVIHGNPLDLTKKTADAAIAARLRLPAWSSRVGFVPDSDAGELRLVLIFDPARRAAGDSAACADALALPIVTVAGEAAVLGVFSGRLTRFSAAPWPLGPRSKARLTRCSVICSPT